MKKKKEMNKKLIIYISIILSIIIVLYLFNPSKATTNDFQKKSDFNNNTNKKINKLIDYKYLYLTKEGLQKFSNTKIIEYNNKFITNLIYNNEVFDKDDTLAQEVVYFYTINKTNLSKKITELFFTNFLQQYDPPEKIRWRNQEIVLIDPYKKKNIILLNKTSLLISYKDSIYKGEYKINVSLYNKIAYFLYFKNGTINIYNISLTDRNAILNIKNKIFPNNKLNKNLKDVKTKYYHSHKKYYLLFRIWKS